MLRRLIAGSALVAAVGCNGWPKAGKLDQAEHKPEKYQTYAKTPAAQATTFAFENRTWMVEPATAELHAAKLTAVGTTNGIALFAPEGAQAPYSILYAPAAAGGTNYHAVVPVE